MFDSIVRIGASLDWISPLAAVAQDLANGPSHTFLIPANCGRTGREIITLLGSRGIKAWGHMIINETIMISVPKNQAAWAQRLLAWAGVPTGDHLVDRPRQPETAPGPERERGHISDLEDLGNFRLW